MNRKAIGMMVVWIFIMIAGGLILLLFFFIGDAQAESARTGLSLQALQRLEAILVTQQASDNTYAQLPIPREQIQFTCDYFSNPQGITSEIRIGGLPREKPYDLIVGRDMMTDELLVFSYRAMVPFSIGNILYVSNEQEALILRGVGYDNQIENLLQLLPAPIAAQTYTGENAGGGVNAANLQNTRVVTFSGSAPSGNPTQSSGIVSPQDAVFIHVQSSRILDQGTVRFWRPVQNDWSRGYTYSGMPMLMAYIWMGDDNRASCFSYKFSRKLHNAAELQAQRISTIRFEAQQRAEGGAHDACVDRYSPVQIENLRDAATMTSPGAVFDGLPNAANLVRLQNEQLLRGNRCATIY